MRGPRAALVYFALVFGVGFPLGLVRMPLLVPRFGERAAELIEVPFMLAAIVLAARYVARRHRGTSAGLLAVGAAAATLVLGADLAVGIGLRGMSPAEVFLRRDPVAGTVYYLLLLVYALMPRFVKTGR